jgi:hypothetical protein
MSIENIYEFEHVEKVYHQTEVRAKSYKDAVEKYLSDKSGFFKSAVEWYCIDSPNDEHCEIGELDDE